MLGGQFFLDRYSPKARADLGISDDQVANAVTLVSRRFEQMKAVQA